MAQDLQTIQSLVEKKALDRLNADFDVVYKFFSGNKLLEAKNLAFKIRGSESDYQSPYSLTQRSGDLYKHIKDHWLPIYISQEAESFIKKVDDLQERVTDLLNYQPEQY